MLLKEFDNGTFRWPEPLPSTPALEAVFDKGSSRPATLAQHPCKGTTQFKRWSEAMRYVIEKGQNPLTTPWVFNTGGTSMTATENCCMTLTKSRAQGNAYWISWLGRCWSMREFLRLQGYAPSHITDWSSVAESNLRGMIGNGMSVPVLEHIFLSVLPAVGLASPLQLRRNWDTVAQVTATLRRME